MRSAWNHSRCPPAHEEHIHLRKIPRLSRLRLNLDECAFGTAGRAAVRQSARLYKAQVRNSAASHSQGTTDAGHESYVMSMTYACAHAMQQHVSSRGEITGHHPIFGAAWQCASMSATDLSHGGRRRAVTATLGSRNGAVVGESSETRTANVVFRYVLTS